MNEHPLRPTSIKMLPRKLFPSTSCFAEKRTSLYHCPLEITNASPTGLKIIFIANWGPIPDPIFQTTSQDRGLQDPTLPVPPYLTATPEPEPATPHHTFNSQLPASGLNYCVPDQSSEEELSYYHASILVKAKLTLDLRWSRPWKL